MNIQKFVIKNSVQVVLGVSAWMAQKEWMNSLTHMFMTGMARFTIKTKRIRKAESLQEIGHQWQRSFPSAKQVPIKKVTDTTVIAEIHTPCPLRGTGDVNACYRMMQFDREVVKKAGGQFVVLSSQAEPGRSFCTVAIRKMDADTNDLVPAHEKKSDESSEV